MKKFPLFEITMLSMCSKRTCSWIKAFRVRRNAFEIKVVSYIEKTVYLCNEPEKEKLRFNITSTMSEEMRESVKIGDSGFQMSIEETKELLSEKSIIYPIRMYMENQIEGLKVVSEYLCSLFEINISSICLLPDSNTNDQISIIEWATKHQKRFQKLSFDCNRMNDTAAEFILSKINQAVDVFICFKTSPSFKTNLKFEGQSLLFRVSNWFSLENLLSINCSELHVNESKLTNIDMNSFLKHWISRDLKFKKMSILMMEVVKYDDLFNGIPFEKRTNDVERVYHDFYGPRTISGGYDIKRNDGMIATIVPQRTHIENEFFTMIVWDKQ
uniref:FBA_2 domain-containing protein n=1 Tax=Caenorhabditis tropicalis TaxID=1561998 RepID=A0A1I7THZ1_9PELO